MELKPCPLCRADVMFRKALWPSDGCVDAIIHAEQAGCGMREFSTDTIDESIIGLWNALPRTSGGLEGAVEVENNSWVLILRGLAARPYVMDGDNILTARDCRTLRKAADEIDRLNNALRALPDSGEVVEREALSHIEWLLPLAKSYAYGHPVRRNKQIVNAARDYLARQEALEGPKP